MTDRPVFIEVNGLSICSENMKIESLHLVTVVTVQVGDQLVQKKAGNPLLPVGGGHSKRQNVSNLKHIDQYRPD